MITKYCERVHCSKLTLSFVLYDMGYFDIGYAYWNYNQMVFNRVAYWLGSSPSPFYMYPLIEIKGVSNLISWRHKSHQRRGRSKWEILLTSIEVV